MLSVWCEGGERMLPSVQMIWLRVAEPTQLNCTSLCEHCEGDARRVAQGLAHFISWFISFHCMIHFICISACYRSSHCLPATGKLLESMLENERMILKSRETSMCDRPYFLIRPTPQKKVQVESRQWNRCDVSSVASQSFCCLSRFWILEGSWSLLAICAQDHHHPLLS